MATRNDTVQQRKRRTIRTRRLKWLLFTVSADLLLVNLGVVLAFLLRFGGRLPQVNFEAYLSLAAYMTGGFFASFYVHDLYDFDRQSDVSDTVVRTVQANLVAILLAATTSFFVRAFAFPRTVFALSFFTIGALVVGFRYLAVRLFPVELPEQWIAVVGGGELAARIAREVEKRAHVGLRFAGVVTTGEPVEGLPALGALHELDRILDEREIDRLILTSYEGHREVVDAVLVRERPGTRIQVVPGIYEICLGRVSIDTLGDIPLIDLSYEPETAWAKFGKPLADVVGAVVGLVLASPLMAAAALAIKVTSEGPVIYRQTRVGQHGRHFTCYKFRTMVKDAERMSGPTLAGAEDPRITPVGRVLRRYRIDELPQLVNIIKGDMSFVGPRPERPEFVAEFEQRIPAYRERHRVKPGVTGLAQVYGLYETDAETKLKYDLIYVYNQSFFLDALILFKTVSVVLTGKGAR